MRPSEAIRLGSMLHPQGFKAYEQTRRINGQLVTQTCAIGAGLAADPSFDEVGLAGIAPVRCPECADRGTVPAIIIHLNDDHRWTRERIADWLEPIENRQSENATRVHALA
jgi:hypothetical protein